ncbi:MAG: hypothetical protein FD181_3155 [Prolixibacteraceae bacterium]|nr:MAG: hypothetical protein FD181_3155 [Prolixibacteraceae bacterium]
MHLYRYQPINKLTLTNLSIQKNWVADPLEFNDPFEFHLKEEVLSNKQKEIKLSHVERYENREKIKKLISNFGVVCYSSFDDSKLMWSHYADSHKGMCLVFEIPKENLKFGFVKVEYSEEIPSAYFDVNNADNWAQLIKIVKTKSIEWQYEKEFRQVFMEKKVYENYPGKLIEIIFGSQTSRMDINLVLDIINNRYENLIISKMYLSIYSFQLGKMSFTYNRNKEYRIPDIWDGKCIN